MTFRDLNIIEPILKAIEEKGYIAPTSIIVFTTNYSSIFYKQ